LLLRGPKVHLSRSVARPTDQDPDGEKTSNEPSAAGCARPEESRHRIAL
jgi:hypothetical protein